MSKSISAMLGHNIKNKRSEVLQSEVEKWLAGGGVINGGDTKKVKVGFNNSLKDAKSRLNAEYYEASRQRKSVQVPVIQEYSNWGGDKNGLNCRRL